MALLCLTLILGCVVCCYRTRHKPPLNKKDVTPAPPHSVDHMIVEFSASSSSGTTLTKLQYEELDGEILDNTSVSESSTPSDETFTSAVSEVKHKVCFQMRRLSSPTISTSVYRPMASSRSSLPSFPRLGLLSKTRKVGEEHKRLTVPELDYTLSSFQTQREGGLFQNYGSNSCNETSFLHFTLNFSMRNTLTLTLVGITGKVHQPDKVTIQVRLSPLCLEPLDMSVHSHENLVVNVGSLEELKGCMLTLSVFSRDHTETSLFEEVEVCCGDLDWTPDRPISCVRELRLKS